MAYHVGKTEGDFSAVYGCPVCEFMTAQPDGTPLHICWGDLWEADRWQWEPYHYVTYCLENGEILTVTGLEGAQKQIRDMENL